MRSLLLAAAFLAARTRACTFLDDGVSDLGVNCSGYGVTLSRVNGALTGIVAPGGGVVSRGSHGGCLFGMSGPNNTYCGSCGCTGAPAPKMAYSWDSASQKLALTFTASGAAGTTSAVALQAYDDAPFFDLTFSLLSAPTVGAGYFWLLFPGEILFDTTGINALHVPILPGVTLGPGFFERGESTNWYYPGR